MFFKKDNSPSHTLFYIYFDPIIFDLSKRTGILMDEIRLFIYITHGPGGG